MLRNHEKFKMLDKAGKNTFWIEANWNPEDENTNEGKVLKFTFPKGETAFIKREDLHQILFALGTEEQQRKLIPQTLTKVRWYETVLSIKATKDIKKNEQITFPIKITLPPLEQEVIGELKKDFAVSKSGIITPKKTL